MGMYGGVGDLWVVLKNYTHSYYNTYNFVDFILLLRIK